MKIESGKYVIELNDTGSYDLYKKVIRKKNDSNETYESVQNIGYGFRFENVLKRIATNNLADKDITVSIKEYIQLYTKAIKDALREEIPDGLFER